LNPGQVVGLSIIGISVAIPSVFWGITYWRDVTKTYCSGECLSGWMAVVSTMIAIPIIAIGVFILVISSALKSKK
jgi:hypothetical protein